VRVDRHAVIRSNAFKNLVCEIFMVAPRPKALFIGPIIGVRNFYRTTTPSLRLCPSLSKEESFLGGFAGPYRSR